MIFADLEAKINTKNGNEILLLNKNQKTETMKKQY